MNNLLKSIILSVGFFAATAVAAGDAGHYRWTDENGVVKYADRPPEGVEAEFIKFASTKHSKPSTPAATTQPATDSAAADAPATMEGLPAKDPKLCKQAQNNLKALDSARIRITEPDGSKRLLNEEEKEAQKENARKFIKVHC